MASSSNNSSGGIGFVGLLTIVFITLKLLSHIEWSWWWVLSPIWISAAVIVGILLIVLVVALVVMFVEKRNERKAKEKRAKDAKDAKEAEEADKS